MGKPTICLGENKDADQLRGNRLCFHYSESTIPLLSKSKISSLWHSSVLVQPGLCQTCWKPHCWFFHEAAQIFSVSFKFLSSFFTMYFRAERSMAQRELNRSKGIYFNEGYVAWLFDMYSNNIEFELATIGRLLVCVTP